MPYNIRKQKCKQSDGDTGSYILSYTDKKGKKHSACHTSKKKAQGQIAAIEGPREADEIHKTQIRETKKMRITKSQLERLIMEMLEDPETIKLEIMDMSEDELLKAYYQDLTADSDTEYVQALEDELYDRGIWESTKRKGKLVKEVAFAPMRSRAHPEFAKAIKGKLNESLQSAEEGLFNAIDEYVGVLDVSMGPEAPVDLLKAEVLNFVDGYFEDTAYAAEQSAREEELGRR